MAIRRWTADAVVALWMGALTALLILANLTQILRNVGYPEIAERASGASSIGMLALFVLMFGLTGAWMIGSAEKGGWSKRWPGQGRVRFARK